MHLSLKIMTSSPQTTSKSQSSCPGFLKTFGQDHRSRKVSSASFDRCCSVGVNPLCFSIFAIGLSSLAIYICTLLA